MRQLQPPFVFCLAWPGLGLVYPPCRVEGGSGCVLGGAEILCVYGCGSAWLVGGRLAAPI